jgi:hypothetical protein
MDTIVAIIKDDTVINHIVFGHDPSLEEITQFVELLGGTSGRKLAEKEYVDADQKIVERVSPYPSWVWNSEIRNYEAPIQNTDPTLTLWNEENQAWEASI